MLILLPPSETKRDGGEGAPLDFASLSLPRLNARRRPLVRAVRTLSRDAEGARRALKLGPQGDADILRNTRLTRSPTMAAIDRYTGVLYDAFDAASLSSAARERARDRVLIHSALFGLIGALDPIPAYRLSHDSRVPEIRLGEHWRGHLSRELATRQGLIVDLRSEGYAELGPAPRRPDSVYIRVLDRSSDGEVRALNHFNKKAKGLLTRALLETRTAPTTTDELVAWAAASGIDLRSGEAGELALFV